MAAHQAPPSLGFSRQEHWSGLPFPSPVHESEKWKGSRSVMSDYSDLMDCSLPGFSVHGIFQARVLGWGAIAFSKINIVNKTIKTARKRNCLHLSSQSQKANAAFLNQKYIKGGFPGGPGVKNLRCSAGDTSSIPGLGRSHMPWDN